MRMNELQKDAGVDKQEPCSRARYTRVDVMRHTALIWIAPYAVRQRSDTPCSPLGVSQVESTVELVCYTIHGQVNLLSAVTPVTS